MENKVIIVIIVMILMNGCNAKYVSIEKNLNAEKNNNEYDKWTTIYPDSTYNFFCNDKDYQLKGSELVRQYFNFELRNCLMETGFNGNVESNKQIAKLLNLVGIQNMLLFGNNPKFRGPLIFEELLSFERDYSIEMQDPSSDLLSSHLVRADGINGFLWDMIETIDGMGYNDYFAELYSKHTFLEPHTNADGSINFKSYIEASKFIHDAIDRAWANDEIILKDYGKK